MFSVQEKEEEEDWKKKKLLSREFNYHQFVYYAWSLLAN